MTLDNTTDRPLTDMGTLWHAGIRRVGQVNFNERDPLTFDVAEWMDYWRRLKVNALIIGCGGLQAFYPTQVPFHDRSAFLGDRDLFGEFTAAAKAAGMRVLARMDPNWCHDDAALAHPEWVAIDKNGKPVRNPEDQSLIKTCMFSSFYTEQMVEIFRELNRNYEFDGFFTNGWPRTWAQPTTFNADNQHLAKLGPREFAQVFEDRVIEIWKLWDGVAKEKSLQNLYVGNLGGGINATTDMMEIAKVAGWFNADNQSRSGNKPIWECAQQGRVAHAVMGGRPVTNITAAYAHGDPIWRHTAKGQAETTLWLAQSTASGMIPWYHWLGGSPEDMRFKKTGEDFFNWAAAHEEHFANEMPIANVAMVFSQRFNNFYTVKGRGSRSDYLQGWYYALLEARIPFQILHEQNLTAEHLDRFKVVILPNTATLSDQQAAAIQAYVDRGGSIVSTFETGCLDEWGMEREVPALANLFDIKVKGAPYAAPEGEKQNHRRAHMARIESRHPILRGFEETKVLPYGEFRLPVESSGADILSVIEPYPAFPPEKSYISAPPSNEPAMVVRTHGRGKAIWFSGDIDRTFWQSTNEDIGLLMANAVHWLLEGEQPVRVEGSGLIDIFLWKTKPGYALHLVNYTSPNAMRGWVRETQPIGPQRVELSLAPGVTVSAVRSLRVPADIPFTQSGSKVTLTVPDVTDYEVIALT